MIGERCWILRWCGQDFQIAAAQDTSSYCYAGGLARWRCLPRGQQRKERDMRISSAEFLLCLKCRLNFGTRAASHSARCCEFVCRNGVISGCISEREPPVMQHDVVSLSAGCIVEREPPVMQHDVVDLCMQCAAVSLFMRDVQPAACSLGFALK